MNQRELLNRIKEKKIVPVVKLDRTEDAKPLCAALCEGGLPVAEITFRTAAAEESIRTAVKEFPEMLVGAGTVVNVEQAKRAVDAGASFLVSPGISREVTQWAVDNQVMIFPGTCTPSEIMTALEYELPVVKFFPASQYGGLATIKAHNVREYLAFERVAACGGSWMVKDALIREGNFGKIRELTQEAVLLVNKEEEQ